MARIAGINIPDEKRIEIALTYIYGIGDTASKKILALAQVDPNTRTKELDSATMERIRNILEDKYKIEGELRLATSQNIKRLKEINSYRGYRHSRNLPVRGQRTKTNARTKRGKRVCVGSGRRSAAEKT